MTIKAISDGNNNLSKGIYIILSTENPSQENLNFLLHRCVLGAEIAIRIVRHEIESIEFRDSSQREETL